MPAGGTRGPAAWKQNMLVLLMLYPVVFLFGIMVQTPILSRRLGLPFPIALFVGNVVSVLLLNFFVPWTSGRFTWWLQPAVRNRRAIEIAGAILVIGLYTAMIVVFLRLY
jgi:antibiotic biosynthesis monooxygenase (ABM) superfamily enzyme